MILTLQRQYSIASKVPNISNMKEKESAYLYRLLQDIFQSENYQNIDLFLSEMRSNSKEQISIL